MKKTFFAIKVSEETKTQLNKIVEIFPEIKQKIKIANPTNPHITLKFFGDTKPADITKIDNVLRNRIKEFSRFQFHVEKCGCFPTKRNPRVLWLGINKGLIKLQLLHNLVEDVVEPFGYAKDELKFTPHLTLGRLKREFKNIKTIDEFINYKYNTIINDIDEIIWFESLQTPKGAIHKPLKKYKLK